MCYLLIIAAPESASAELSSLTLGELSTWRETNASISSVIPDDYSLHAIGVARHCSCGCVRKDQRSSAGGNPLVLDSDAAQMIEMAVHVAGQVAFIAHWISTDLESEEFDVAFGAGVSRFMLREPQMSFEVDQLVWVAG